VAAVGPDQDAPERFPPLYTAVFVVLALGLIGGGLLLWLPACGGPSTATSDLGLALMGGGLALSGGFVVAVVVFAAERRFDRALRRREEAAERENLKLTLSMSADLRGVDLHGRDLRGIILRKKDLRDADLREADLSGSVFEDVDMEGAHLKGAMLEKATLGLGTVGQRVNLLSADLTGAHLRGATIWGDIRSALFFGADLRGADLARSLAVHPHPENASEREVAREAAKFDGAKYDDDTQWPDGVDPVAADAVKV
jgi:uncharacterized protein YjbI with pentapeptide repeats